MNAEKMIKNEAKRALSGKWPAALMGMFLTFFITIIAGVVAMGAYSVIGDTETSELFTSEPVKGILFVVLHIAAVAAVILLSPLYCGFARFCGNTACGKEAEIDDLFSFFENSGRYKSTVVYMAGVLIKALGMLLVCEAPAIAVYAAAGESETMVYAAVALAMAGLCAAFLWYHRFAFEMFLFTCCDYDGLSASKVGANAAKGNVSKLIKLTVSFVPWLLSTFFMIPLLYVSPYMTCSYFTAVKYLVNSYLETASQAANTQAENTAAQAQNTFAQAENTAAQAQNTFAQAENTAVQSQNTFAQAENTAAQAQNTFAQAVTLEKNEE